MEKRNELLPWALVNDSHLSRGAYLAEAGLEQRVRHVALRHLERSKQIAALVSAPEKENAQEKPQDGRKE